MTNPAPRRPGGCSCAKLRYEITADPIVVYICHCTDCQTATGASFAISMIVPRDALRVIRGEVERREFELPDGRYRIVFGCSACGAALWGERRDRPEMRNLEAGTLDDTSWFRPVAHIWTRSAQPWIQIPDDVLNYAKQPKDRGPMLRAWQARSEPEAPEA